LLRTAAWESVPVCVDDASRLDFAQIVPDESQLSAVLFLERALSVRFGAWRLVLKSADVLLA
jgi:hypothetical protein